MSRTAVHGTVGLINRYWQCRVERASVCLLDCRQRLNYLPVMVAIIPNPHVHRPKTKRDRGLSGLADRARQGVARLLGRLAARPRSPLDRVGVVALVWTGLFLAAAMVLGYTLS